MPRRLLIAITIAGFIPALAHAEDGPTIAKDSVLFKAESNTFQLKGQATDWLPTLTFRVNDPIPDGSHIAAEVFYAGKKPWLKSDCVYKTAGNGQTTYECIFAKNRTRYTGTVDFVITLSNELQGKTIELMHGKAIVSKSAAKAKNQPDSVEYYVDEDWRVPIAYLQTGRTLKIEMVFRGKPGEVRPYLFADGKQVAAPENCGAANFDPDALIWWPVHCEFFAGDAAITALKPGDYEIKVLQGGKLVRTAALKVSADGSYDNGIATASKLGSKRVVIPMKTLVDHHPWNKQAYKTGAYFGNPLTGFVAP